MSTYGVQQTAPDSGQVRRAVLLYTGLVIVATIGAQIMVVGLSSLVIVTVVILTAVIVCALVGLVGLFLAGGPAPAPGPGAAPLFLAVVILIMGCYFYSHSNPSGFLALAAGVASALAWGLSVVGALIWGHFGILSSIYWNSWFNLFAAAFAALAVGYTPPGL
jgi:hypothetical protein